MNNESLDLTLKQECVIKLKSDSGWYLYVFVLFAALPPFLKINSQHRNSKDKQKVINIFFSLPAHLLSLGIYLKWKIPVKHNFDILISLAIVFTSSAVCY